MLNIRYLLGKVSYYHTALIGILLVFAGLSIILPWGYDDSGHLLAAITLSKTGIWGFPETPMNVISHSLFVTIGPTLHFPVAFLIKIGFLPAVAARLWVTLHSFLIIFVAYLFRRSKLDVVVLVIAVLLFSVQFLNYGARYLGEIPGIAYLLLTVWAFSQPKKIYWTATIWGVLSISSKEYFLFPLFGLALFRWLFCSSRSNRELWVIASWIIAWIVFYIGLFGTDIATFLEYWQNKFGYKDEFYTFSLNSVHFLLFKPVLIFGTAALWVEYWAQRKIIIRDLAVIQTLLGLMFLLSAGYDRFGLWLLPAASIGLAPWLRFLKNYLSNKNRIIKYVLFLTVFLIISQRTLPMILHWTASYFYEGYGNTKVKYFLDEKFNSVNSSAIINNNPKIVTCEVELVLGLKDYLWQLPVYPPMAAHQQTVILNPGDWFISGPFSESVYYLKPDSSNAKLWIKIPIQAKTFFFTPEEEFYSIYQITQSCVLKPSANVKQAYLKMGSKLSN